MVEIKFTKLSLDDIERKKGLLQNENTSERI